MRDLMKVFVVLLLLASSGLFTSCEKEYLTPETGDEQALDFRNGQKKATDPETHDPIDIVFEKDPDKTDEKNKEAFRKAVTDKLDEEIKKAKQDKDAVLQAALKGRKKDFEANLDQIYQQFCEFDGINVTYFQAFFYRNTLVIEGINLQLFNGEPTDLVRAHEDGHSHIADELVNRLGDKIAQNGLKQGLAGKNLWNFISLELQRLDDCAQECYDEIVDHDNLMGDPAHQTEVAMKVANSIIEAYCEDPEFDCEEWCQQLKEECEEQVEEPEMPEDKEPE